MPKGDRTVIITNGGGIGVLATDAAEAEGINLYSGEDLKDFKAVMPPFGSYKNPVDITGGATVEQYVQALRMAEDKDTVDSIALLYCETAVCDPEELAEAIKREYKGKKPLVVAMVGGEKSARAVELLNEAGIPAYDAPEDAMRALSALHLWQRYRKKRRQGGEELR